MSTDPRYVKVGATYMCARCVASADLQKAIEGNDSDRARFIQATFTGEHAAECSKALFGDQFQIVRVTFD